LRSGKVSRKLMCLIYSPSKAALVALILPVPRARNTNLVLQQEIGATAIKSLRALEWSGRPRVVQHQFLLRPATGAILPSP
jgi:hypothetical protein